MRCELSDAVFQQDQAMSASRDALLQARSKLSRIHTTGINQVMAAR
jgi:hypothetical protein